ncbi:hypothetical protein FRB91_002737 [Serendipita sp. 411]|nr:hypothetical protein FRC18_003449 [Serendipita sp. 400]KAG8844259.1 hypothetical protein FRB91_002737 [Serendipita sp. 411]
MNRPNLDIPVELWMTIFESLMRTWLIPHPDFDVIDSIRFLQSGCSFISEYFRIERVKTNLRLVCKQWNAILSVTTIGLAIEIDRDPTSIPNYARIADRLHMVDELCPCRFGRSREKCETQRLLERQQRAVEENFGNTAPVQRDFRTRVLCTDSLSPERLKGFLESDPPLQALSITPHAFITSVKLHCSAVLQRVTHLCLEYEPNTTGQIVHLSIPNLVTLDYAVYTATYRPYIFNGPAIIGSWSLPKLKTLILRHVAISGKLPPSFNDFILSHKSTLVELIIYCNTVDHVGYEVNGLLELVPDLPNLEIFGMDAQSLLREPPDMGVGYHTDRQRILLLDRFSFIELENDPEDRIKQGFETLFKNMCLFVQIWLCSTWAQLAVQDFERQQPPYRGKLYHMIEALQYARDLGISLQDREGVSLNDEEWEEWTRKG